MTAILTKDGARHRASSTPDGEIAAEHVVIASGMWSRGSGATLGVDIPLQACEHFYIVTEPFPGLTPDLPVLRDPDHCAYYKEDAGKLLLGAFEPNAKPWALDGIPEDFEFGELPEDFAHFEPILEAAMRRLPALGDVGIRKFFNGPESFTPDVRYLLGEAPDARAALCRGGIQFDRHPVGRRRRQGAGRMDRRRPSADGSRRRRHPPRAAVPGQPSAISKERVSESLGLLYAMHWPYRQYETARNVRISPLHERLAAHGACFGEAAGWERANWFAPRGRSGRHTPIATAGRTGSSIPPPSIARCARRSRCST